MYFIPEFVYSELIDNLERIKIDYPSEELEFKIIINDEKEILHLLKEMSNKTVTAVSNLECDLNILLPHFKENEKIQQIIRNIASKFKTLSEQGLPENFAEFGRNINIINESFNDQLKELLKIQSEIAAFAFTFNAEQVNINRFG